MRGGGRAGSASHIVTCLPHRVLPARRAGRDADVGARLPTGVQQGTGKWGTHGTRASHPRRSKAECGETAARVGSLRRDEPAPGIRSPELRGCRNSV